MNPQSEGEYELGGENHAEQSRGCIATSYLPLSSDIAKLSTAFLEIVKT
jgi:hypothetical protein